MTRAAPLTLTDNAIERIKTLLAQQDDPEVIGIRVGVNSKGCSGLAYEINYATDVGPIDDVVEAGGVKVIVDPSAAMFIIGSVMDYVDGTLKSGFEFSNPNEAGRCGCGESFFVERDELEAAHQNAPE